MKKLEEPQFKHDCDQCTYLGRDINTDDHSDVDMYFCPQNGMPTIIMRYGDNGSDYASAPVQVINTSNAFDTSPLLRNMLIAEDRGLWERKKDEK